MIKVPATSIARRDLGTPVVANMVMLGALWQATQVVSRAALERAISEAVPPKKIDLNLEAFQRGVDAAAANRPEGF